MGLTMIELKVLRKKRIKLVATVMICICALIVATSLIIFLLARKGNVIYVEAGEGIDLCEIFGRDDVEFDFNFKTENLNHPGTYEADVIIGSKIKRIKIVVTDTRAPEIEIKEHIYISSIAIIPTPDDFIKSGYDPDGYAGYFLTDINFMFNVGKTYSISVQYKDPSGNKTQVFDVKVSFIDDTTPPIISTPDIITFATDDAISYKTYISALDNCIGDVTLAIDDSNVDYKSTGEYKITVTATDIAGNSSLKAVTIKIVAGKNFDPTLDKLNKKLGTIINQIITEDMSKEEKCRQIYAYIQKNISYSDTSASDNYIEAAYDALFISGEGDCFAYFASAKAMLNYVGIENMDIERSDDGIDGTHFWNYVNIGTSDNPLWYHFDSTRLTGEYNETGCLLTNVQLNAYDAWRFDDLGTNFRQFDKSKYPKAATEIITETPKLKDYMD